MNSAHRYEIAVFGLMSCLAVLGFQLSAQAASVLNFPRLSNQPGTVLGVTFVNPTGTAAQVTVTAYGTQGQKITGPGITNPAVLTVSANGQEGRTIDGIFGSLPTNTVGWFQAVSPADGLTGFWLFLDNPLDPSIVDGANLPPIDHKIFFNQIRIDGGYSTELNIFNTQDLEAWIIVYLVDGAASYCREFGAGFSDCPSAGPGVPGKGLRRISDVADFFDVPAVSDAAYVLVVSDSTLLGGFQFVRSPEGDLLGLNARSGTELLNRIYFPQLAVLGPWAMEIGLLNYSPETVSMIISAHQPDGSLYRPGEEVVRNSVVRVLEAGVSLREDVETMFGFSGATPLAGWIEVEATSEAVNGYVTYGIPADGSLAAVAAQTRPLKSAIISHIATSRGLFTGVAALNPAAVAANLRIMALTRGGALLGRYDTVLGPGERIAETLSFIIPGAAGQAGGVVWLQSDVPLYFTSLFGTVSGTALSNVPAQLAPETYRPDDGLPSLQVSPHFTALALGETRQFEAQGSTSPTWSVAGKPGEDTPGMIDSAGLYQAPNEQPAVPVAVLAQDETEELIAAATVDVLAAETLTGSLDNLRALTYSEGAMKLYAARTTGAAPTGTSAQGNGLSTDILEIDGSSSTTVVTLEGEEVTDLVPYQSFDGGHFLLAAGAEGGRVVRIAVKDSELATGSTRDVVTGLDRPSTLLVNPLTRNLLVATADGITQISGAQLESDLVSGLEQNGNPPARLVEASNIAGLAVDRCSGDLYYSDSVSGEVKRYSPATAEMATVLSALETPGALLALTRKDGACGPSLHLLVAEEGGNRISLFVPDQGLRLDWFDADSPSDLAFLPEDNSLSSGESVLTLVQSTGAQGTPTGTAGDTISLYPVADLYQNEAVNPLDAVAFGSNADPTGDTFQSGFHEIVQVSAYRNGDSLDLTVYFADSISPCIDLDVNDRDLCTLDNNPFDAVTGIIDIDVDRDPETGLTPWLDYFLPLTSGLGVDMWLDFGNYNPAAGGVSLNTYEIVGGELSFPVVVARYPVNFQPRSLKVSVPLSALGGEDQVDTAFIFGTPIEATDGAPNRGFVTSVPAPGTAPSGNIGSKSSREPSDSLRFRGRSDKIPSGTSRWVGRHRLPQR